MRTRDGGRLLCLATRLAGQQLKASASVSDAICPHFNANVLRRPYSAVTGGLQVMRALLLSLLLNALACINAVRSNSSWQSLLCLQSNYAQASASLLHPTTFASSCLLTKISLLSSKNAPALVVKRSASADASTAQKLQEAARTKAQNVLAVPRNAVQNAKESVSSTTNAVLKQMPKPVSHCNNSVAASFLQLHIAMCLQCHPIAMRILL